MEVDENPKIIENFFNGIKCRTLWKMAPNTIEHQVRDQTLRLDLGWW